MESSKQKKRKSILLINPRNIRKNIRIEFRHATPFGKYVRLLFCLQSHNLLKLLVYSLVEEKRINNNNKFLSSFIYLDSSASYIQYSYIF